MKIGRLSVVVIIFLAVSNLAITQVQSFEKLLFFDELQQELRIMRETISQKAHKIVTVFKDEKINKFTNGTCSHIVINGKDYVLTASHVVEKPVRVEIDAKMEDNGMPKILEHNQPDKNIIKFSDRFFMEYIARENSFPQNIYLKIVGASHDYDVVILEPLTERDALMLKKVPAVSLADYSAVKIGDLVFGSSAPLGEIAFSQGYIMDTDAKCDLYSFKSFRADLYAAPGSSGGPLFNFKGEVIGIMNFIDKLGGTYGPTSDILERILPLLTRGHLAPKMIGAVIVNMEFLMNSDQDLLNPDFFYLKDIIKNSGLDKYDAVVIAEIIPNSPAVLAGLKAGYVIEKINGKPVKNTLELINEIRLGPDNISLGILIPENGRFYKNIFYINSEKQNVIFE